MKIVKWLVCIFFFLLALTAFSQETKPAEERAAVITAWMKDNLKLGAIQEKPVADLNLKYAKQNDELKTGSASRMQKFKALKANEEERDNELKRILTAEQFKLYESKNEELKRKLEEAEKKKS